MWHECALIKVDRLLNSAKILLQWGRFKWKAVFEAIIFIKMFGPHPLEKYCNALANSKIPRIAKLSPWYVEALLLTISPARLQLQVPCS